MTELVDARGSDWHVRVKRDRGDICIPARTEFVVRPQATAEPGEMVVVRVGEDHVLRRYPTADGPVTGVVLGVVVEVSDVG